MSQPLKDTVGPYQAGTRPGTARVLYCKFRDSVNIGGQEISLFVHHDPDFSEIRIDWSPSDGRLYCHRVDGPRGEVSVTTEANLCWMKVQAR